MTESRPPASPAPPAVADVRAGPAWVRLLPWIIAGVLALLAAGLTVKNLRLRREHEDLRTERDLAQTAYQMMSNQLDERTLLAERMITDFGRRLQRQEDLARLRFARLRPGSPAQPDAQGIVVWDPTRNAGLLVAENLTEPPSGEEYHICVLDSSGSPPSRVADFAPDRSGGATVAFAVSGPPGPESRFVVLLAQKGAGPNPSAPVVLRSP